jgi:hypothetical protein
MSIRKSPQVTEQLSATNRANARASTGPRTPQGKAQSRWNALKYGGTVSPGTFRESMPALGEDGEAFDRLCAQLREAYRPADNVASLQVEDLAKLYWRRSRLERARDALLRSEIEQAREEEAERGREARRCAFEVSDDIVLVVDAPKPRHRPAQLLQRLCLL